MFKLIRADFFLKRWSLLMAVQRNGPLSETPHLGNRIDDAEDADPPESDHVDPGKSEAAADSSTNSKRMVFAFS